MTGSRRTRVMSVWCDLKPPFCNCSKCIGPECKHALIEYDYDTIREVPKK